MKPGFFSSEFIVMVASMLVTILTAVMNIIPQSSVWAVILGSLLAACTYIAGRSWLKVATVKADAIKAVTPANPTLPQA